MVSDNKKEQERRACVSCQQEFIDRFKAGDERMAKLECAIARIEKNTMVMRDAMAFVHSTRIVWGVVLPVIKTLAKTAFYLAILVATIDALMHGGRPPEWIKDWAIMTRELMK